MSGISKRDALLFFVMSAGTLLRPTATAAQEPAETGARIFACDAGVHFHEYTFNAGGIRTYATPDKPLTVDCNNALPGNGKGTIFSVNAASGMITDPNGTDNLDAVLTNEAYAAYMNNTPMNAPVPLPQKASAPFAKERQYLQQFTFTAQGASETAIGNASPWGITAGLHNYTQIASERNLIASDWPQQQIPLAAIESLSRTQVIGLTGATLWEEAKAGPGSLRLSATGGYQNGRGKHGGSYFGDATYRAPFCEGGVHVAHLAKDSNYATETLVGLHAACAEILPGGVKLTEKGEISAIKHPVGYPDARIHSGTAALFAEKAFGKHVDFSGIVARGGNTSAYGGVPEGDNNAFAGRFVTLEGGVELKLLPNASLTIAGGRLKPTGTPNFYTFGQMFQGEQPGYGTYRNDSTLSVGINIHNRLFRLGKH